MKKLLFGMAFFMGAMVFSIGDLLAEEDEMRWKQLPCTDGSGGTYEVCWLTGDGNICDTWGEQTRDCDLVIEIG
ncbi:hypothetical protein [Algoriphagus yeomjeoni]|uniref:Uncharacterized protein n=1 Tax=Algoriphagus yeomjeoni TaxID=291403 RepID=A0A327PK16_9BACT|nr:hypothetical protein [Algoriphagus yeomjeoni]RAI90046.1 hypothetical protein LV83_02049 [Algoriphagus yeomjeoni]